MHHITYSTDPDIFGIQSHIAKQQPTLPPPISPLLSHLSSSFCDFPELCYFTTPP